MWKLADYSCVDCGAVHEELVLVGRGQVAAPVIHAECPQCKKELPHSKMLPLFARYTGERVSTAEIHGGKYDTMGKVAPEDYPELPGEAKAKADALAAVRALGDNASARDRMEAMRSVETPGFDDYVAHASKPEVKEIARENKRIAEQNREKRKRAKLMRQGRVKDLRSNRCAGDPKGL